MRHSCNRSHEAAAVEMLAREEAVRILHWMRVHTHEAQHTEVVVCSKTGTRVAAFVVLCQRRAEWQ